MPSYNTGQLLKGVRVRKNLPRKSVIEASGSSDTSMSNIENGAQLPKDKAFRSHLNTLGIKDVGGFSPYFTNQTFEMLPIRWQILDSIKNEKPERAKALLKVLEKDNSFQGGVNLQFVRSCYAQLALLENRADDALVHYITEALHLTFPEFDENKFMAQTLIYEEPYLIHMLAETHRGLGQPDKALRLLNSLQGSIEPSPIDNYVKQEVLPAIMLDKARILIEKGEFIDAVPLCGEGITASIKWNRGKDVPHLLYEKAVCLKQLRKNKQCAALLRQAYACYVLLGRRSKADELIKNAKTLFRVKIEPLEMRLNFDDLSYKDFYEDMECIGSCKSAGEMLSKIRKCEGLSKADVYGGISLSSGHYNSIEAGEINTNFFYLEAFLQRTGRDVNYYTDTFISQEDFDFKQKIREVHAFLLMKDADGAERLLNELEVNDKFKSHLHLQFIASTRNTVEYLRFGKCTESGLAMLQEALKKTIPDFDEKKIKSYRLTYEEILLINKMAAFVFELGDAKRAVDIYEQLKICVDTTYVHETEKVRTYPLILRNYAESLRRIGRYEKSLEIIEEGERLCVKHQRLTISLALAENRAYDLFLLGETERSLQHFKLAYGGYLAVGDAESAAKVKAYVKENLNIGLE